MPVPKSMIVFVLSLAVSGVCSAGSGSKPRGGGASYGRGSGAKPANQAASLENSVLRYQGKLVKGAKNDSKEATLEGRFRLQNGYILAASAPTAGSGRKTASVGGAGVTLVAYRDRNDDNASPAPANALGDYRLSRRGKLTLFFGTSSKRLAASQATSNRAGVSDAAAAPPPTAGGQPTAPGAGLNGVMVLSPKKLRSGEFWAGSFREQDAKGKTVRTWKMRVQPTKNASFGA